MNSRVLTILIVIACIVGCGNESKHNKDPKNEEVDSLRQELANKNLEVKTGSTELERAKKELAEREVRLNASNAMTDRQAAELKVLGHQLEEEKSTVAAANQKLAEQEKKVAAISAILANHDNEVAALTEELAVQSQALKDAVTSRDEASAKQAELTKRLAAAKAEREKVAADLVAAITEKSRIEKSLADYQRKGVQAFLENVGPETMFGGAGADVADAFPRRDKKCAVVIDLGPDLEMVRGSERTRLPNLSGYSVLAMRVAYRKIAICDEANKIEAQVEHGQVYKLFGNGNERIFVGGRNTSTCDKQSNDMKNKNVFGGSPFQVWSPFRGEVDGIETIDIPSDDGALRLHMGSALIGAATCAQALNNDDKTELVTLACKVLSGAEIEGKKVIKGCFAKKSSWGRVSTYFSPE
jgi:hypothetical protein